MRHVDPIFPAPTIFPLTTTEALLATDAHRIRGVLYDVGKITTTGQTGTSHYGKIGGVKRRVMRPRDG